MYKYHTKILSVALLLASILQANASFPGKALLFIQSSPVIQSAAKDLNVRGRVLDDQGHPLSGAVIKIKGGNKATTTNTNGEFELKYVPEGTILLISYLGFETKAVKAEQNIGTITLATNTDKLQEVEINAGYYTINKRELTGSISKITASTIEKQPISNPLQALQGRIAGLEITQMGGLADGGFKVQIRGRNSITASSNDPLYIIDGINYPSTRLNNTNSNTITDNSSPLSLINPSDIESIEVLKDADATAIYGSRGANGVILITTKKGTSGTLTINANFTKGFNDVAHRLDLLDIEKYLAMRAEAFKNNGLTPLATDYDVNGTWDKNKNTDWQQKLIGKTAQVTNAALSASGGNKDMNYLLSENYYQEGTVFPGNFGFKRGGIHTSLTFGDAESKFKATFSGTYGLTISNLLPTDPTSNIMLPPNYPDLTDQYGKPIWTYNNTQLGSNPMAQLLNSIDRTANNLVSNINLNYRILKQLTFNTSISYNSIKTEEIAKRINAARDPANNPTSASRESLFSNNYNNSWIAEPQLNYQAKLGPGKLTALLGMSFQQNSYEYRNISASNFSSDEVMDNIGAASVFSITESDYSLYKYAALYTRLNYSLSDKYYVNLTGRRDGSSRFGPRKQFGNFGAIGAAWIFSEESLIKENLSFLSYGKLRASYGFTGSDQIPNYGYMQLFGSTGTYQGTPTLNVGRIANPDYGWETNKKTEVAIELGFLKNSINIQVSYFKNRSSNQLLRLPLPPSVGATQVTGNLPATVQNTGLELEGTFKIISSKNWRWSANFNLTLPKNKLVNYPGLVSSANANTFVIGQPLDIRRYYHTYVDPQTGYYTYEDKNGNGTRDNADLYLNKFLGQLFYGGLQNAISYKQFSLDFLISFSKQNGKSVLSSLSYPPGVFLNGVPTNTLSLVLNRWQNVNDQTDIPKFTTKVADITSFSLGKTTGSQSIEDASFARLKNVSLSYNLNGNWLSRLKVRSLQLNLQGQNTFTLTRYKGLDPESQSLTRLPPLRNLAIGLKLTI